MGVAVANAVEVVVLQYSPSAVFVRPLTEQNVLSGLVFPMGFRAAGVFEWLVARCGQRDVPLGTVNFVVRREDNRVGRSLSL